MCHEEASASTSWSCNRGGGHDIRGARSNRRRRDRGRGCRLAGAPVPHATLAVTEVATNNERRLTADDRGRFMVTGLVPGEYRVTAQAPGFAPRRQEDLMLAPNERATVQLALRRALIPETLTVAEIPANWRRRVRSSPEHHNRTAREPPEPGREPLALSELVVATTVSPVGSDPSVMAYDPSLNSYTVDGFNRKNSLTGASQVLAPLSADCGIRRAHQRLRRGRGRARPACSTSRRRQEPTGCTARCSIVRRSKPEWIEND